jgi:hypothetical protein
LSSAYTCISTIHAFSENSSFEVSLSSASDPESQEDINIEHIGEYYGCFKAAVF